MRRIFFRVGLGFLVGVTGVFAQAQNLTSPDAGSILRDIQRALPVPVPKSPPEPARIVPRAPDDTIFVVKRFNLTGVTLIAPVDVQAILKPWLNRDVVFADLEQALQAIAKLYQDRGWYVRPQLPEQDVVDGVVLIDILEAQLGGLKFGQVEEWPVSRERIERMFEAQHALGEPLNLTQMNRGVSLINELPGVGIKAALAQGEQPQTTDILISVEPKSSWTGSASVDNQGSRSTGIARASLNLSWDNPAHIGDQVQTNLMTSQGVRYVRLSYNIPLGYRGWRLGVNTSGMHYRLMGSFDTQAGTWGTAYTRGAVLTYPVLRSQGGNVNFSLNYSDADYVNYVNGAESSRKTGHTLIANLGGDFYDHWAGGGTNLWGVSLAGGQVVKSFNKITANLARLQRLDEKTSLWLSWSGQYAFNNLDSSEKFTLGGAQGVRAYPGVQGNGDKGLLLNLEARQQLRSDLQALVFYDHGLITYSHDRAAAPPDNTQQINSHSLRGLGVGLNYTFDSKTTVKVSWSHKLGDNPVANATTGADADGSRLLNRFWVNVSSFF